MSASKTIFKIVFLTIFLFALLLFGIHYVVDENKYKPLLQAQLNKMTGVEIPLNGQMKVSWIPLPHIELKDIKINMPLSKTKALNFQVEAMSLALPWKYFYQDI